MFPQLLLLLASLEMLCYIFVKVVITNFPLGSLISNFMSCLSELQKRFLFYKLPCYNLFCFWMQTPPYIPTITTYTKIWWVPNVVVAHQKEGIIVIHLASGRTMCKVISLPILSSFVHLESQWMD